MAKRILVTIATWYFNSGTHEVTLLIGEKDRKHECTTDAGYVGCLELYSSNNAPSEYFYQHVEKEARAIVKLLAPRAEVTIRYSMHDLRQPAA